VPARGDRALALDRRGGGRVGADMIFDEIAKIIEREHPKDGGLDYFSAFQTCAIFDLRDFSNIQDIFRKTFGQFKTWDSPRDSIVYAKLTESMFLPFDFTFISVRAMALNGPNAKKAQDHGVLLFADSNGINARSFEIYPETGDMSITSMEGLLTDTCVYTHDYIENGKLSANQYDPTPILMKKSEMAMMRQAVTELLWVINHPRFFIVECAPTKLRPYSGIKNTAHRPVYTVLHLSEIVKKYGLTGRDNGGTHASPSPHPRRAHLAVLRSERYTHKRGQTIKIPAVWVGPKEVVKGNHRYRILVDK
jgi:hypothetical protein